MIDTLRALFIYICCCLPPFLSFAQAPKLKFKHISLEQGLSNSTIESIYQDKRGFIWVGTRDGLNRFDGYQMVVYRFDPHDSTSISDNYIRYIYEDRNQQLWVGTINGLNRFDQAKNNFTRYKHIPGNPQSLSNNLVTCIYQDQAARLWVGTFGGGIDLFQPEKNSFAYFQHDSTRPKSLSDDRVNYFYEDSQSNFWIATEDGLNLFNRESGTFRSYQHAPGFNADKRNNTINVIKEDRLGNLLLGTAENGLIVFSEKEKIFTPYKHFEKDPTSLASNLVRSLLVDKKGTIWIGSVNGGLDFFHEASGHFYHYQNEPDNLFSLSQRTVSALFEDDQQNLWVGTHRGGLNLYMPNIEKFNLYRQEPDANSLSYNDVKAFCEDSHGRIWIGTDGGGLNLFDQEKNDFRHFKYDPYDAKTLGSNEVLDIMEDGQQNLWVGTWGGGLSLFNPADNSFHRFLNDPSDKNSISSNYIQKIFEDEDHNLWIATYYGGLNLFNRKTRQFTRITEDNRRETQLLGNNIVSINQDRRGNIWMGTDDGGLNCFHSSTHRFSHYFNKEEKTPDLRILFVDSKGRLWVGQTGLYLYDPKRDSFSLYTDKAGLSMEFIKGIAEDDQGNFWISTSNGITQFNPETYAFKKYNTADGLQGVEFEANAYLKTKGGEMFFGGLNGFNTFYPENIKINTFIPPVYITDFQVFNKKILVGENDSPLDRDISMTDEIKLSYEQSTFSFGFAALNYTALENNQYAYRLEGRDHEWNYVGSERRASYTNLAPGNYTFRVKASNNDGIWNEHGPSIVITITPPFWETWWFRTLAFILLVSIILRVYRFKRKLEWRKLEEQKKEEMHQVQLQFFTNISHELRTPLSLILGPIELLQKEHPRSENNHYYKVIYRNANRLMSLINELMDFRKSEAGVLKLHVMPGSISLFLNEIYEEFSELAIQKNISFKIIVPQENKEVWFDRQVLEKIAINLISNSFKYTDDGGSITTEIRESLDNFKAAFENELILKNDYQGEKYIYLRVVDNGIGISKDSIAHLFERYYKITESHLGSGIGLAFVKSLTTLHKGHIRVYSERDKGTEIIIGIPVSKEDYEIKERWIYNNKEASARLESIHSKDEHELPDENAPHTDEEADAAGPSTWSTQQDQLSSPTDQWSGRPTETDKLPHILVVDDNQELRNFLKESLAPAYHITEAKDGISGLAMAKEEFPDLIISDVMMPGMDGIEFCRQIKENIETSHIPFLMLTAKDALESRLEGVESGADFYFAKPLSIQLLTLTIRNILSQKQKLKKRYFKDNYSEAKELVHSRKDKEFMDQLSSIIESHLTNPDMDVDYICMQMGMSRTKLYQKIKNVTGQSIGEFVRKIRLRKAVQLMTHQDVSLMDVMYSVGIQTQSYFTKAFKKEFGKTPSQFLKELNK
jgi:ligand-binding sensor domain-containing protein/signal transduction histidine kinase/DNA-binding response OmpR family regulator